MEEELTEYQEKKTWPVLWKDENDIIYPVIGYGLVRECWWNVGR